MLSPTRFPHVHLDSILWMELIICCSEALGCFLASAIRTILYLSCCFFGGAPGIRVKQKSSETLLWNQVCCLYVMGEKTNELHIQTSFVKAASHPALMWTDQLDGSQRLNMTENQLQDCHMRSMERSVTNDRISSWLIEMHHGTGKLPAQGAPSFLELRHPICLLLCLDIPKVTPSK